MNFKLDKLQVAGELSRILHFIVLRKGDWRKKFFSFSESFSCKLKIARYLRNSLGINQLSAKAREVRYPESNREDE